MPRSKYTRATPEVDFMKRSILSSLIFCPTCLLVYYMPFRLDRIAQHAQVSRSVGPSCFWSTCAARLSPKSQIFTCTVRSPCSHQPQENPDAFRGVHAFCRIAAPIGTIHVLAAGYLLHVSLIFAPLFWLFVHFSGSGRDSSHSAPQMPHSSELPRAFP